MMKVAELKKTLDMLNPNTDVYIENHHNERVDIDVVLSVAVRGGSDAYLALKEGKKYEPAN